MKRGTLDKVFKYFFDASSPYIENIKEAFTIFFGEDNPLDVHPDGNELFNEWLLFDFKLPNGKTLLDEYFSNNPEGLDESDLKVYKTLLDNKFGIFEIEKVTKGDSMDLIDLQSKVRFHVEEKTATKKLKPGCVFIGRIGRVSDHMELVSGAPVFLQGIADDVFRKNVPKDTFFDPYIIWHGLYKRNKVD